MIYFCTYFDHRYLSKGMALYHSLKKHCPDFKLWILCLSCECYEVMHQLDLDAVCLIPLADIEEGDKELLKAKGNRSLMEYYFTLTPSLPLYILNHFREVDLITYLDSDLFFFSDPKPIYDEMKGKSVGIISHRFPHRLKHSRLRYREKTGDYNLGWVSFRRNKNGQNCLRWYRERCNEWCYDRVEGEKYADQKYLDKFQELFAEVHVIQHKGANLAPWNIDNYKIVEKNDRILVDGQPLIFFHFHAIKKLTPFLYDSGFSIYQAGFLKIVRDKIYLPYIKALEDCQRSIPLIANNKPPIMRGHTRYKRFQRAFPRLLSFLRTCKRIARIIYTNSYIFVTNPKKT